MSKKVTSRRKNETPNFNKNSDEEYSGSFVESSPRSKSMKLSTKFNDYESGEYENTKGQPKAPPKQTRNPTKKRISNLEENNYEESSDSIEKPPVISKSKKTAPPLIDSESYDGEDNIPQPKSKKAPPKQKHSPGKKKISNVSKNGDEESNSEPARDDDDEVDIDQLLTSSSAAAIVSSKITTEIGDSDDYDAESEALRKNLSEHNIPPLISSDSEDSYGEKPSIKKKVESNVDEDKKIDFNKVHEVFDELNELYKYGDEPIWEVAPEESDFQANAIVKDIISKLKKNNTGKQLLAEIRKK